MHYIHHRSIAKSDRWPAHLAARLARETIDGVALIDARCGWSPISARPRAAVPPATIARRTPDGWRITGRKTYSTGAPILGEMVCGLGPGPSEPEVRLGIFLVPAGLPGTRIIEDLGSSSGCAPARSHDVVFDDVLFPLDHEVDVRAPQQWLAPDNAQIAINAILVAAVCDGVAQAARDFGWSARKPGRPPVSVRALATSAAGAGGPRRDRDAACRRNARLIEQAFPPIMTRARPCPHPRPASSS